MKITSYIRSMLSALFFRTRVENEMNDELRFHIEARADDLAARQAISRAEALRLARLEFGSIEKYKDKSREARGLRFLDELFGDLHYGMRQLRRSPIFTIVAVAILAIGVGANTTMFTLINAVILKPLPVPHPEQLRQISWTSPRDGFAHSYMGGGVAIDSGGIKAHDAFAYPIYVYLSDRTRTLTDVFCWTYQSVNLKVGDRAEANTVQFVSGHYFSGLGVDALVGRVIAPDDNTPGKASVAVVSYTFWQRALGDTEAPLGQLLRINGVPVTVIGVLPRSFFGINSSFSPDVVLPLAMIPVVTSRIDALINPYAWQFQMFGRLRPGVSERGARSEIETLLRQAILGNPQDREYDLPRVWLTDASGGLQNLSLRLSSSLMILSIGAGLVLVIACANLAGMLLARSSVRSREIGTRLALGARRARIVRQLLTESVLLAAVGGGAGMAIALVLPELVMTGLRQGYGAVGVRLAPDIRVLVFSLVLSGLTAVAFGLAPALCAGRIDVVSIIKQTPKNPLGQSHFRFGKALVTTQIALCLVLLVASGLFIRTLMNLDAMPLGFRADGVITFHVSQPLNAYKGQHLLNLYQEMVSRLESLPGVASVSLSYNGILTDSESGANVHPADVSFNNEDAGNENVRLETVGPKFFETMGIPFLAGRDFTWRDREDTDTASSVIINEALAHKMFPGMNPIGRTLKVDVLPALRSEIVGVAADSKYNDLRAAPPPTLYVPFMQENPGAMIFALRSETEPSALIATLRRTVQEIDSSLAIDQPMTQQALIDRKMSREIMLTKTLAGFGAVALFLVCLGIYGMLAYSVARRTFEIGIRKALGAQEGEVVRSVIRECSLPVFVGVLLGVAGSLTLTRLVGSLLFGISPTDSRTHIAAILVILVTVVFAAYLPARRASRIDPMTALRNE